MNNQKISTMSNHELVCKCIDAYSEWAVKANGTYYSTASLAKRCHKLSDELVKRGLLTKEEADYLNK